MSAIGNIYEIPTPFVLYCGCVSDVTRLKVARGVVEWARHKAVATYKDTHKLVPELRETQDLTVGKTLVIGLAPFGGQITQDILDVAFEAISAGLNVAAGLHSKLSDIPELVEAAEAHNVKLYDFRHRPEAYPLGNGLKRDGFRILTVGTDCSCGKKYTALTLYREFCSRKADAVFCSTGQTGFLISNSGINNDTITADFLSGAAESLSPSDKNKLYIIEGQGSIEHPAYCGGSLSLIAGSQPDVLVMCHAHGTTVRAGTSSHIDLSESIANNMSCAYMLGHNAPVVALSINFSKVDLTEEQRIKALERYQTDYPNLYVFDPSRPCSALDCFVARTLKQIAGDSYES